MKRTIFIGQAMPRIKRNPHDWPTLNKWLYEIGLVDEDIKKYFCYSALVDYFPGMAKSGGHLVPTPEQIAKERKRLEQTIKEFAPQLVVPIGSLSISYCLQQKRLPLNEVIGTNFEADPYGLAGTVLPIIPLPHPSGASTWYKRPGNKELLAKALNELKTALSV